jgi:hypothetical protein
MWTNPDAFTTTLLVLFLDKYGTEGLKWDPATIAMEVEQDFGVALSGPNFDRLMTGVQLLVTDDFYKSLPTFIAFCNVLAGGSWNPELWDPADALEIAWGITEALLISPPEDEEPFTEEIRAYIGYTLDAEGIMQAPDVLRIAARNTQAFVQNDFSDDPEMFAAMYAVEQEKTNEINKIVRFRFGLLAKQLEGLELRTGDARGIVRHLSQVASQ